MHACVRACVRRYCRSFVLCFLIVRCNPSPSLVPCHLVSIIWNVIKLIDLSIAYWYPTPHTKQIVGITSWIRRLKTSFYICAITIQADFLFFDSFPLLLTLLFFSFSFFLYLTTVLPLFVASHMLLIICILCAANCWKQKVKWIRSMFEFVWTESSIKTIDGVRATLCVRVHHLPFKSKIILLKVNFHSWMLICKCGFVYTFRSRLFSLSFSLFLFLLLCQDNHETPNLCCVISQISIVPSNEKCYEMMVSYRILSIEQFSVSVVWKCAVFRYFFLFGKAIG